MYPWLEWQKQNNPETKDDPQLHSCPFCASLHLSVSVGFEGKAARVYCRKCQANGPWIVAEKTQRVVTEAKLAWNSCFQGTYR